MTIDLSTLQKMETISPSRQATGIEDEARVLVLVELKPRRKAPAYLHIRGKIAGGLHSADLRGADLARLEADPAVKRYSLSKATQSIE